MKMEKKKQDGESIYHHLFSTLSVTLILLLILAFIGSTIYIGYNSFVSRY